MREIKRVLETIIPEDDKAEVVTEGTTRAAVAVPVVVIIVIATIVVIAVVICVSIYIVRRLKKNRYSTRHSYTLSILELLLLPSDRLTHHTLKIPFIAWFKTMEN